MELIDLPFDCLVHILDHLGTMDIIMFGLASSEYLNVLLCENGYVSTHKISEVSKASAIKIKDTMVCQGVLNPVNGLCLYPPIQWLTNDIMALIHIYFNKRCVKYSFRLYDKCNK
jgi:hypothetical protein